MRLPTIAYRKQSPYETGGLRDINTELHKALHELVVEDVEYMILNSLGDPYKKQTINNAITAMDKNTEICK